MARRRAQSGSASAPAKEATRWPSSSRPAGATTLAAALAALLAVAVVAIATTVSASASNTGRGSGEGPPQHGGGIRMYPVRSIHAGAGDRSATEILQGLTMLREPTLLSGFAAQLFPQPLAWTDEELAKRSPRLRDVQVGNASSQAAYLYSRKDQLWAYKLGVRPAREEVVLESVPITDLLSSRVPHAYYSAPLEHDFSELREDLEPGLGILAESAETMGELAGAEDAKPPLDVNVWMGTGGPTAHTHYDKDHNFFVQVRGTKRFKLAPPEAALDLQLYPRQHPNYRQVQGSTPATLHRFYADLTPGDVLYLPPCWLHTAVANSTGSSLSLNVWAASQERHMEDAASKAGLPRALMQRTGGAAGLATFLMEVLRQPGLVLALQGWSDPHDFLKYLFQSRYSPLPADVLGSKLRCDDPSLLSACQRVEAAPSQEVQSVARKVARVFSTALTKSSGSAAVGAGPVVLALCDYIEQVVGYVMGPQRSCAFLKSC